MAITRRQFIKRTGLATAGTLLAPSVFRNPFVQKAFADTIGDRYLVVMFLDGGNDGLNTVPPYDNGTTGALRADYENARTTGAGGIQILQSELNATLIGTCPTTGTPMALHPGMTGLKNLYEADALAVVQGVGYPNYSLSHEEARFFWQSGNPTSILGYANGWVGRYFEQAAYGGLDIPALSVNDEVAPEFRQTITSVLATHNLSSLKFPYDEFTNADKVAKRACFDALYGSASGSSLNPLSYLGNVGNSTLGATDTYPNLPASPLGSQYSGTGGLNTSTARDLSQVAKVINAVRNGTPNINARHFQLRNGGYDTHSDQGGGAPGTQHYNLHKELGDAMELFYNDCAAMGVENKVLVVVYSEFARRIEQNDSGTDHGSQGPVFVIGGGVNAGVYGSHPDINSGSLNDDGNTVYSQTVGNPYRSTDFRDVYGTILKHWLNIAPATITSSILPVDTIIDPDNYWNTPNFDMGFL